MIKSWGCYHCGIRARFGLRATMS